MKTKIIIIILLGFILVPNYAYASNETMNGVTENPSYLIKDNDQSKPYDLKKPSVIYNVASKGQYKFSGVTHQNPLYTNYLFVGKTSYYVNAESTHTGYNVNVTAYKNNFGLDSRLRSLNTTTSGNFTFSTSKTTDQVYLKFLAPTSFSGYIK